MKRIKGFFKSEVSALRKEISILEYICWWIIRVLQIYVLVRMILTDITNNNILLLALNLLATFTVPLARLLLFPKKIFTKLSFHCQTWLDIMIFFGSFLAQGLGWNHSVAGWDKFLHFIAGAFIVFIGDGVAEMFMSENERVSPLFRTFAATGFSYIAMVIWEEFEFFVDFYWQGSSNQAYNKIPDDDNFFFMIFGQGAQNENQWAVFDTDVDMFCAIAGSVPAAIVLYLWQRRKQRREVLTTEKEKVTV